MKTNIFQGKTLADNFNHISNYKIIAITGPMAAGKNYICSQLESQGFVSIDADKCVHEAIKKATPEILKAFQDDAEAMDINLLNNDGTLNRRALGVIVFSDSKLLAKQESIVYPVITKMIEDFIDKNSDKKIIINATVLYKTPALMEKCQAIVFVTAPFFTRLERARKRDHLSYKQIFNRFRNQKSLLNKYKEFNKEIVIVNNKNTK